MDYLEGALRTYPWGSRTLLAELRNQPVPSPNPEAELWFGAHPAASSTIGGRALQDVIRDDPEAALGARVARRYDNQLPFLVKLLAAGEPLSIQAHPSREQALDGFARENAQGLALDDPRRNYKDANPKPELIVALSPFRALAGFRPAGRTYELFNALGGLHRYSPMLVAECEEESLRAVFTSLISLPSTVRLNLLAEVGEAARGLAKSGAPAWMVEVAETFLQLAARYPGDVGPLAALMLNHVTLPPGGALYLDAGQPHAYLSGLGVEVMANSDNVLRGGLTSKHVDVPELARVLNFTALERPHAPSEEDAAVVRYQLPVDEFRVSRHCVDQGEHVVADGDGPAIVLCTAGSVASGDFTLTPGEAVWLPATDPAATFMSDGIAPAELFYVTV